jgi:hypothetical protein
MGRDAAGLRARFRCFGLRLEHRWWLTFVTWFGLISSDFRVHRELFESWFDPWFHRQTFLANVAGARGTMARWGEHEWREYGRFPKAAQLLGFAA